MEDEVSAKKAVVEVAMAVAVTPARVRVATAIVVGVWLAMPPQVMVGTVGALMVVASAVALRVVD